MSGEQLSATALAEARPIIEAHEAIARAAKTESLAEQAAKEAGDVMPELRRNYRRAVAARQAAWDYLHELQDAECKKFATSRGWRVYGRGYIYGEQLIAGRMVNSCYDGDLGGCIDHRDCFVRSPPGKTSRQSCRYPAAILTHTYGPYENCERFAQHHGLNLERLPWSWYYPGAAIAALFTTRVPL